MTPRAQSSFGWFDIARYVVPMVLAAIVAYYTTTSSLERGLSEVKTRQEAQFDEILRRFVTLQDDIREIRALQVSHTK